MNLIIQCERLRFYEESHFRYYLYIIKIIMCYLRPLRVKKIIGRTVALENGVKAYYDKKIGTIKKNDLVMVYGNLITEKLNGKSKQSD